MTAFFLSVVNVSITAGIVAVAVILLRLLFKKAPRWVSCALWALVGLRLVLPFAPESSFSLIPSTDIFTVQTSAQSADTLKVHTGITQLNSAINGQISSAAKPLEVIDVLAIVWVTVAAAVLIYGIVSYLMMFLRVRIAIPLRDNIYQSENVKSPFVLGFFKPRIYIPFNLKGRTLKYVLSHEEAHIKRKDHIVKPLAFLLLSIHWFNPFLWLSYVLLCRDIEVACDEKVIRNYSINKRKDYAFALLDCKVNRSNIAVCPVAFGEVNVSTRIKKTLCYKKPAVWVVCAAVAVLLVSAGCFLTNPKAETHHAEVLPSADAVSPVEVTTATEAQESETTLFVSPTEATITETVAATPVQVAESTYAYYVAEPVVTEPLTEAVAEPTPAVTEPQETTEATEATDSTREYYYYEYGDSEEKDYVELEIPTINN